MNDISCKQCGEPYSAYALKHDVATWEGQPDNAYEKFMRGEGCPTCDWGDKAGEVSLSATEDREETESRHYAEMFRNTDDDPVKFL